MAESAASIPAKELLDGLYAQGAEHDADWSGVTDDTLQALRQAADSGDAALQSLMTNLAFSKFQGQADQAQRLSSALAGIKAFMVAEIFDELPTTSIEELRAAAEAAGYDVEVLA
ncbi:hypothetical protein [Actinomadura rubrisoli]|uniref:Uncharacterized protein n=1 Tax=Actinomadura rubrisoli TaxID=2530368 RepID=A0A4V2YYN2_9ACTN|nr:hypothetical protein [Actinomadura rubrisoli]TDD93847.1 hypothetical protein E1298_08075 [Actinomadura rubrisoli]